MNLLLVVKCWLFVYNALIAQLVERIHGKDEVSSSNLLEGSGVFLEIQIIVNESYGAPAQVFYIVKNLGRRV